MLAEPRTTHPFHFYDALTMQPQTWAEVISRVHSAAEQSASRLATARQIFLIGIHTRAIYRTLLFSAAPTLLLSPGPGCWHQP